MHPILLELIVSPFDAALLCIRTFDPVSLLQSSLNIGVNRNCWALDQVGMQTYLEGACCKYSHNSSRQLMFTWNIVGVRWEVLGGTSWVTQGGEGGLSPAPPSPVRHCCLLGRRFKLWLFQFICRHIPNTGGIQVAEGMRTFDLLTYIQQQTETNHCWSIMRYGL